MLPSRQHSRSSAARRGLCCALLGWSLAKGQNLPIGDEMGIPDSPETTGFLAGSLLPDGGILKNVLIPQYDQDLRLTSVFRSEELVIVTRKMIDAHRLRIEFFNPDRSPRGLIAMAKARYDASREILTSDKPVSLVSTDLTADGSGLVYDVKNTRGFLLGPVTAVTAADKRTSMNTRPVRPAAAALLLATLAAPATEPDTAERIATARLDHTELARLDADALSRRPAAEAAAHQGRQHLIAAHNQGEQARLTMTDFFRAAALTSLLADPVATAPAGDVPRPDVQPGPVQTRITSDDGAFFDSKNGLLVFLKNVVVHDPRFQLSGADEVKVFFEPKENAKPAPEPTAKPAPEPVKKDDNPMGDASFGKPSRMVATGTVVIDYRSNDPAEPPLKASARTFVYDVIKKEIILRGGSPWVLRDGQVSSVPGNDAYIVIQNDGSFVTGNGGIDATVDTQEKTKDKKETR